MNEQASVVCRVLFLVPQKARAARIAQLIPEFHSNNEAILQENGVRIDYLPAVASFGSYKNEEGKTIHYLSSIDYFGAEATLDKPESLLPFFDEEDGQVAVAATATTPATIVNDDERGGSGKAAQQGQKQGPIFTGISAVAIGPGLDAEDQVSKINVFFETMSQKPIPTEVIRPNPEYTSMKEESMAFQNLDADEKRKVTRLGQLGPGKVAKFVTDLAVRIVEECLREIREKDAAARVIPPELRQEESGENESPIPESTAPQPPTHIQYIIDPNKVRYSCRKCRTILFGEDDMEDPPHAPSRHRFSVRKIHHGGSGDAGCQSFFLQSGKCLSSWMGDLSDIEGRIACPKCSTKVGAWHWSGAQCSCGTWVVPAIQIPKSKVDEIVPFQSELPLGTVVFGGGVPHPSSLSSCLQRQAV